MARTISQIMRTMIDAKNGEESLQGLSGSSATAIWRLMFFVVATGIWIHETLFDAHLSEVDERIRNQRVHTPGWYRSTALEFQFGKEFMPEVTEYDNTGVSDEEIQAQRIIQKCSVTKSDAGKPTLIVKVHKADGKLEENEKTAFEAYMNDKSDAGVNISVVSENADRLVLYLTVRYDAMLMDGEGMRFMDGKSPVPETVVEHLNHLQFNGTFYPSLLEQELMRQTGIRVATVRTAMAGSEGTTPTEFIDEYAPYSGAIGMDIENDLYITYERF